jgi:hypothetical protein
MKHDLGLQSFWRAGIMATFAIVTKRKKRKKEKAPLAQFFF